MEQKDNVQFFSEADRKRILDESVEIRRQRELLAAKDFAESKRFLKGLAWGLGLSSILFWIPLGIWIFG